MTCSIDLRCRFRSGAGVGGKINESDIRASQELCDSARNCCVQSTVQSTHNLPLYIAKVLGKKLVLAGYDEHAHLDATEVLQQQTRGTGIQHQTVDILFHFECHIVHFVVQHFVLGIAQHCRCCRLIKRPYHGQFATYLVGFLLDGRVGAM